MIARAEEEVNRNLRSPVQRSNQSRAPPPPQRGKIILAQALEGCYTACMKGKKKRLHQTPAEFAEAEKARSTEEWKRRMERARRLQERFRNAKWPSHIPPKTDDQIQDEARGSRYGRCVDLTFLLRQHRRPDPE